MGQQQSRRSWSVGTKLLISLMLLLGTTTALLDFLTILILREDKKAYTLQAQSMSASLLGKELRNTSRHVIEKLRLALATADPAQLQNSNSRLKTLIENQSEILMLELFSLTNGKWTAQGAPLLAHGAEEAGVSAQETKISPEWAQILSQDLARDSYAFLNLSRVGGIPLLGVLVADPKPKNPQFIPIALGVISLKDFAQSAGRSGMTLATRSGWVLYDSDPAVLHSNKNIAEDPLFSTAVASKVSEGTHEFEDSESKFLGSYSSPGLNLIALTRTAWSTVMKSTYTLIEKFILLGMMTLSAAVIFAILFSRTLTAPIYRLYEGTKQIAQGNFSLTLRSKSNDEIGALTDSFNVMSSKISALIQESMEKVKLENELAIASTVQQNLIPPPDFQSDRIRIVSRYQPASQCGGDWWGFFGVGDKICVMIADATGHGFPSALITAAARSCVSFLHKLAQEDPDFTFSPSAMLSYANRIVFDASIGKIMMTFFVGVIDLSKKQMSYSSAGHNPPWLFAKNQQGGFALKSLVAKGVRLGETRECVEFEEKTIEISPQDILFLYTDGLLEGKNLAGEMFGKKRMRQIVERNLSSGLDSIATSLMKEFMQYNEGKALDDDCTLAAAQILS